MICVNPWIPFVVGMLVAGSIFGIMFLITELSKIGKNKK